MADFTAVLCSIEFRNRLLVSFDWCSRSPCNHFSHLPFSSKSQKIAYLGGVIKPVSQNLKKSLIWGGMIKGGLLNGPVYAEFSEGKKDRFDWLYLTLGSFLH